MKIGILGTGTVARTIGARLIALGHEVKIGSRKLGNENASAFVERAGRAASAGTFADAAAFGEIVFLAVAGNAALDVVGGEVGANLVGKILIDVTNPLDFSHGMPPVLIPALSNTTSLGEELQKALPRTRVVKSLNTMNADVMVDPGLIEGRHDVFVCGEDAGAKAEVVRLLQSFGWHNAIDLGGISAARGTEAVLPLWLRLWGALGHPRFNFHVAGA
ncbi:MAG TPA: NAD(P)-binding domain-containing protein [Devosiaceae bacterium]